MLTYFGASVASEPFGEHGRKITLEGRPELTPRPIVVPVDPSSAAFLIAAALLVKGSEIVVEGVMMNPLRTGFLATLLEMGARIDILDRREEGGEEVADLRVRHSELTGRRRAGGARPGHDRRISHPRRGRRLREGRDPNERLAGIAGQGIRPPRRHRRRPDRQWRQGDDRGRRSHRRGRRGRRVRAAAWSRPISTIASP